MRFLGHLAPRGLIAMLDNIRQRVVGAFDWVADSVGVMLTPHSSHELRETYERIDAKRALLDHGVAPNATLCNFCVQMVSGRCLLDRASIYECPAYLEALGFYT